MENEQAHRAIATCQKIVRLMTGVILGAFVVIIVLTTASTGPLVQASGKLLYCLIVLAALFSLGVWIYRVRLEKQAGKPPSAILEAKSSALWPFDRLFKRR